MREGRPDGLGDFVVTDSSQACAERDLRVTRLSAGPLGVDLQSAPGLSADPSVVGGRSVVYVL